MENLPYGVAIWTTGIGTSPLVHTIRSKIEEQTNRVALITDEYCQVKGSKNIFSIGKFHSKISLNFFFHHQVIVLLLLKIE